MNCFQDNVVPPSWTLILPESWDESKNVFKGEVDGFKIGEGEWRGGKNTPARSHCSFLKKKKKKKKKAIVRLANPYTRSTGTLIGAVSGA